MIPNTPGSLSAQAIGPSTIRVWFQDNSDNETGFIIQRADNPPAHWPHDPLEGVVWREVGRATNTGTTQFVSFDDLNVPNGYYQYKVIAYNADGQSPPSQVQGGWGVIGTTLASKPVAPSAPVISSIEHDRIQFSWALNAPAADPKSPVQELYNLVRIAPNGDNINVMTMPAGHTLCTYPCPNGSWTFCVGIGNVSGGAISPAIGAVLMDTPVPSAPVGLAANAIILDSGIHKLSGVQFSTPTLQDSTDQAVVIARSLGVSWELSNAFDNDPATFMAGNQAAGNNYGLDLGEPKQLTSINFFSPSAPRQQPGEGWWTVDMANDMCGGVWQGSLDGVNYVNLFTMSPTVAPPPTQWNTIPISDPNAYRYVRLLVSDAREMHANGTEFYGVSNAAAISLSWSTDHSESWLKIMRSSDGFVFQRIATLPPGEVGYVDTVTRAGSYTYKVISGNTVGTSEASVGISVAFVASPIPLPGPGPTPVPSPNPSPTPTPSPTPIPPIQPPLPAPPPPLVLPIAPVNLVATLKKAGAVTSATLTWLDRSMNESNFIIQYQLPHMQAWSIEASVPANVTAYAPIRHTGVVLYRVAAKNAAGPSSPTNTVQIKWP